MRPFGLKATPSGCKCFRRRLEPMVVSSLPLNLRLFDAI